MTLPIACKEHRTAWLHKAMRMMVCECGRKIWSGEDYYQVFENINGVSHYEQSVCPSCLQKVKEGIL